MKVAGIYQIQSKIEPHRIYIGSSFDVLARWKGHLISLAMGNHHSRKFQYHYNKYGESDLIFSIIMKCSRETLIAYEQYYIDVFNPYFNASKVAGSILGYKHSDEAKKKISEFQKNRIKTEKEKRNLSEGHKGRKHTEEQKRKIGISNKGKHNIKGRKLSEITKEKISKALKNRPKSDDFKLKIRKAWALRKLNGKDYWYA